MDIQSFVDIVGQVIDVIGVFAIVWGVLYSLIDFMISYFRSRHLALSYEILRQNLGKTLIIGLELLIAGDIIRSIAVPPTFTTVGVLAIIVLIRAFLTAQVEKETRWHIPWKHK